MTSNKEIIAQIKAYEQEHQRSAYINRNVSWLAFNDRVLQQAQLHSLPLLERLNFLAITASNLDEFLMVRYARLKDLHQSNSMVLSIDGRTATQELPEMNEMISQFMQRQKTTYKDILQSLEKEHISLLETKDLSVSEKKWVKGYFIRNIFPSLTPLAIDPKHSFPLLPNLGLAMLFSLQSLTDKQVINAILPLPAKIPRFVQLPKKERASQMEVRLILLEDIIALCEQEIFNDSVIHYRGIIRIIRDSDYDIDESPENLREHFENAIKTRRRGSIIRIHINKAIPEHLLGVIQENLHVSLEDIHLSDGLIGLANIREMYYINRPDLKFLSYEPRYPERIHDFEGDCFAAIEAKDFVIHHPYESFDVVVRFLMQAAADPDVVSIKHTIYRTSSDSPIIKALIEAAEAGKSVTVLVELKARFDEEANLLWSRNLERAGAQVVYTASSIKMHGKLSLIVRRVGDNLRSYVHIGTGNYHPANAKIYSDLSFFSCDETVCRDIMYLFNYLTGYSYPSSISSLAVSPISMRQQLTALIDQEIAAAKAGKPAAIWAKLNSLADKKIINHLYKASMAGVHIDLFIRGICCLRPGIKGISDNIHVKSMVGRFLEHARMVCFANGEEIPSPGNKVFLSSADWMTRNFDERVEIMLPITNPTVHEQILGQILVANYQDERQSWYLDEQGDYLRASELPSSFCAHEFFMTNPSLSGRGKALKNNTIKQNSVQPVKSYLKKSKK